MSRLSAYIRRVLRTPGVPQARHVTERAVAPYLRADLTSLHETMLDLNHRLVIAQAGIEAVEQHMPSVLNSIASTNGVARLLRRETAGRLDALESRTAAMADQLAALEWLPSGLATLRSDFEPHIGTIAWLNTRVETIRAEMLHELRYGRESPGASPAAETEIKVVREGSLDPDRGPIRLNLGCGHIPMADYVNVDMRELPGVDVVAPVDDIPVEKAQVEEIFSAHVLEHFPEMELTRRLLPYWFSLLRPGGVFRAVVPDLPSMIDQYTRGEIDFQALRLVAYGGQEYEGDFHFTAFTTDSLTEHLTNAGFDDVEVLATGRPNGDCLEFEIAARRPE